MKCISRGTLFYKRALPMLWMAFMLVVTVSIARDIVRGRSTVSFSDLLPFWAIGVLGYVINWLFAFGLADEVLDAGDHLVIRIGATSARVALTDIESVSEFPFSRPRRITLRLGPPGPLGRVIAFLPFDGFLSTGFWRSRVADDLMERVERARRTQS
jgi:hypothetical protein